MIKIKEITFKDHPVLGNLNLNFCNLNGEAVDTIIIAGENGIGKSTILDALYKFATGKVDYECEIVVSTSSKENKLKFEKNSSGKNMIIHDQEKKKQLFTYMDEYKTNYIYPSIFSDVAINFKAGKIENVTSLDIDMSDSSRRSDVNLPTKIKQLLIDIQTQDALALQKAYYQAQHEGKSTENLNVENKMQRFIQAFDNMFDDIKFENIDNINNHKDVLFNKNGTIVSIDNLSSGEKQIVYRGGFLLQDVNALKGALVLIDEPEISMHPRWQKKILNFYRDIFTNDKGEQTSQIVVATHSPFIIHNDNRRNDKVIVLKRDKNNNVMAEDKPEYYKCESIKAVEDAFEIQNFNEEKSTVFLEGRTDEKYFNKAVKIYQYKNLPFQFKWVGHLNENGQEENTGSNAVDKAFQFLVGRNLTTKQFCLKDCDTNSEPKIKNNAYSFSIPKFDKNSTFTMGIENALVLEDFDVKPFYSNHENVSPYNEVTRYQKLEKTNLCDAIVNLPDKELKKILIHLKEQIDFILKIYYEE